MTGVAQYVALLPFAVVAAVTDGWRRVVPNWLTYPGMLVGVAVNVWLAAAAPPEGFSGGEAAWEGFQHGLAGWAVCGGVVLVCFVLFPIGGGDVKLVAMMGAFLGVSQGIEALLWTFVIGAVIALGMLIWQVGAVKLIRRSCRRAAEVIRTGGKMPMAEEDREPLQQELFLAVAALLAVLVQLGRQLA